MAAIDEQQPLHILFLPFLVPGHLIPIADMAALFAARGVRCTILTTPVNAAVVRPAVERANEDSLRGDAGGALVPIDIAVVPFPDVGLPPGVENGAALTSEDDVRRFFHAIRRLREPFDRFMAEHRPDAVVSDGFFTWSADAAAAHGVPRLVFLGTSVFARLCNEIMVFNSFHELEPECVEHHRAALGRRAWLVGPVALASKDVAARGAAELSPDVDGCLRWLDTKPDGSVVYVSFGTVSSFSPAETRELARGLDLSGMNFAWVISGADEPEPEWTPEGFAELIPPRGDRGRTIRGWAPQVLVLNHPAVGVFVTHCGWNSTLEAVSAGVPMVTWPRYSDQFYNERHVVEVLGVGVGVGARDFGSNLESHHRVIGGEVIAGAIRRVTGDGEEGEAILRKAAELAAKARAAPEKGGSSYDDVGRLMDELMARRTFR
ncbi:hypothetical protein OsJ_02477 [Oryza sativa Japonica Group]|uniref:Glycosyltransferase n=1 Tax=Oryza sativa subsp. japonica TaxID=39947 RepID=A2ZV24_ORYSJ|nr:hypothetical protein OsJ_02477 [Oryza sativa Japonica Group]